MRTILAIDFDHWAAQTYRANFPETEVRCASVADEVASLPYADIVTGGFPCQPHSLAGKRKASADERDCGPDFVAAVRRVRPRMFLGENVAGILSSEDQKYVRNLVASIEDAGYVVQVKSLDAVNFGVPQFRMRVWFWGIRCDLWAAGMRHQWPKATHCWPPQADGLFGGHSLAAGIAAGQALGITAEFKYRRGGGLIERGGERRSWTSDEPSQAIIKNTGKDLIVYDHGVAYLDRPSPTLKAGGNFDANGKQGGGCPPIIVLQSHADAPVSIDQPAPTLRSGGAGHDGCCLRIMERPSPTLVGGSSRSHTNGASIVNDRAWRDEFRQATQRRLTPNECRILQSAPGDFKWPEGITKTQQYRVIGNGWAARMGAVFAEAFHLVDPESETTIDLFCGGGLGACGWHGKYWSFDPLTPNRKAENV